MGPECLDRISSSVENMPGKNGDIISRVEKKYEILYSACGAIPMLNAAVNCFQDIDSECESRGRKPKKDRDHCDAECAKTERFARSRACKEFLHRRLLYSVVIIELISNSSPPGLKKNDWLFPRNCCT